MNKKKKVLQIYFLFKYRYKQILRAVDITLHRGGFEEPMRHPMENQPQQTSCRDNHKIGRRHLQQAPAIAADVHFVIHAGVQAHRVPASGRNV